jgi:hypothetical protein
MSTSSRKIPKKFNSNFFTKHFLQNKRPTNGQSCAAKDFSAQEIPRDSFVTGPCPTTKNFSAQDCAKVGLQNLPRNPVLGKNNRQCRRCFKDSVSSVTNEAVNNDSWSENFGGIEQFNRALTVEFV